MELSVCRVWSSGFGFRARVNGSYPKGPSTPYHGTLGLVWGTKNLVWLDPYPKIPCAQIVCTLGPM